MEPRTSNLPPWPGWADDPPAPPPPPPRRVALPAALFVATCLSTYLVGGPAFAATLMSILLCHELGHFLQAVRYGVPASYPYFLPMPISPIGTMGAVIAMRPGIGDRKALFDIAVTGPLAGLVPALVASWIGLRWSEVTSLPDDGAVLTLGEPLAFRAMSALAFGDLPEGQDVLLHPVAFAGWVGLFITALNLVPIGQLDGGHILYALLRRRAHVVAQGLLVGAVVAVLTFGYWGWILMLGLLWWMGARHPPTADDTVPLGRGRRFLGWACFVVLVVGFTPEPFALSGPEEPPVRQAPGDDLARLEGLCAEGLGMPTPSLHSPFCATRCGTRW